jgi:tetratricopeptide (TPR) repeat protein
VSAARTIALALLAVAGLPAPGCGPDAPDAAPSARAVTEVLDERDRAALAAAIGAQQQAMPERVGPLLEGLLARDPPPADAQFVAGSAAYDLGRYGEAAERLGDAVRRKPEFLPAASALGFALRRQGDYDAAADVFARIVAARPDAHKAHYGLGLLAVDVGRAGDARRHLEHALAIRPDYLKARFALARVLIEEGRLPEARAALEELLVLWPAHEQALYQLALVLGELGEDAASEAVLARREEVYRLGEEVGGLLARRRSGEDDPRLAARLVELYLALGEPDDARRELQLGLLAAPDDPALRSLLPRVEAALQAPRAAREGGDD